MERQWNDLMCKTGPPVAAVLNKMHFPTRLIRAVTNLGLATGDPGPVLFVFTGPFLISNIPFRQFLGGFAYLIFAKSPRPLNEDRQWALQSPTPATQVSPPPVSTSRSQAFLTEANFIKLNQEKLTTTHFPKNVYTNAIKKFYFIPAV